MTLAEWFLLGYAAFTMGTIAGVLVAAAQRARHP